MTLTLTLVEFMARVTISDKNCFMYHFNWCVTSRVTDSLDFPPYFAIIMYWACRCEVNNLVWRDANILVKIMVGWTEDYLIISTEFIYAQVFQQTLSMHWQFANAYPLWKIMSPILKSKCTSNFILSKLN